MFEISANQIISLTRGDTASTLLYINLGTELQPLIYDLQKQDKIYFGVMEPNQPFECAILKKVYTHEDFDYERHLLRIYFDVKDTEFLLPGQYYYMIKLYRPNREDSNKDLVDTIVPKTKFYILD